MASGHPTPRGGTQGPGSRTPSSAPIPAWLPTLRTGPHPSSEAPPTAPRHPGGSPIPPAPRSPARLPLRKGVTSSSKTPFWASVSAFTKWGRELRCWRWGRMGRHGRAVGFPRTQVSPGVRSGARPESQPPIQPLSPLGPRPPPPTPRWASVDFSTSKRDPAETHFTDETPRPEEGPHSWDLTVSEGWMRREATCGSGESGVFIMGRTLRSGSAGAPERAARGGRTGVGSPP